MDIHAVFSMVKDLFKKLFLHSPKRTFFVIGGLIVLLALPITLMLTQQSQDNRQRAACIGFGGISIGDCGSPDPYQKVCHNSSLNDIPLVVQGSYTNSIEAYEAAGLSDMGEINLKDVAKEIVLAQTVAATAALGTLAPYREVPYAVIVKDSIGRFYVIDARGNFGASFDTPITTYDDAVRIANSFKAQMQAYGITSSSIGDANGEWKRIADMLNTKALAGEELDSAIRTAATNLDTTYQGVYRAATDGTGQIDNILAAINRLDSGVIRRSTVEIHTLSGGVKTFADPFEMIKWLDETKAALTTIKNAKLITKETILATEPLTFGTRGASKLIPLLKVAAKGGFVLDVLFELTRDTGQRFYSACSTDRKYMSAISINTDLGTFQYKRDATKCPEDSVCTYQSDSCVQCTKLPKSTLDDANFAFVCDATNPRQYKMATRNLVNFPPATLDCGTNKHCSPHPLAKGIECLNDQVSVNNCSDPSGSGLQFKCSINNPGIGWTQSNDKTCGTGEGNCYWYAPPSTKKTCAETYAGSSSSCLLDFKCSKEIYDAKGTTCENQGEDYVCCGNPGATRVNPIVSEPPQMGGGGTTINLPTSTPSLPSVGNILVENCVDNDPGSVRFNWTREQSGLNYEVRWGTSQSNLNEKLTFGETSQTNTISGFSRGLTVYYSIRAYLGTVAGPSSIGKFTVPNTCNPEPIYVPPYSGSAEPPSGGIASGTIPIVIPVTEANESGGGIEGKQGYNAVFDPSQGGWVYVPELSPYAADPVSTNRFTGGSYGCGIGFGVNTQGQPLGPDGQPISVSKDQSYYNCSTGNTNTGTYNTKTGRTNTQNTYPQGGDSGNTGIVNQVSEPPSQNLTCDPNKDGTINQLDLQWIKDEMTGARTSKEADCFKRDNTVNALDFQVWKDINFGKRQAF